MNQKKKKIHLLTLWVITLFFALPLKAQVTIGSLDKPHSFSILELTTMNKEGGLRLPQLNNEAKAAVEAEFNENPETAKAAKGLTIYNTDTNCMEYWNGKAWVSLCIDVLSPIVAPEENPTPDINNNIRITTYINAMYDFQYQKLTAYLTSGDATAYQWQMSKDGAKWYDIVDAKKKDYVVPADFMYKLGDLGLDKNNTDISSPGNDSISIRFRCQITIGSATANTAPTRTLNMLFIRTNTAGYGQDIIGGNAVRYLTIQTGNTNFPSGRMKIALLNLGQSGTGAWLNGVHKSDNGELNDAGDLGDFYQWGRVADGHEHTVWSKNTSVAASNSAYMQNQISPYATVTGDLTATSMPTSLMASIPAGELDGNGQVLPSSSSYGKFVATPNPNPNTWWWGDKTSNLWGNSSSGNSLTRNDGSDIPFSSWTAIAKANNPCPSGWYVPSIWNLWDINTGDGADDISIDGSSPNVWSLRSSTNSAYGAAIISNNFGELVFLPQDRARVNDGALYGMDSGIYWSSTYSTAGVGAFCLNFMVMNFNTVQYLLPPNSTEGRSVRCVKE